jgi:hypothetical protein
VPTSTPTHASVNSARTHLRLTHGFEGRGFGNTEADAIAVHDALPDHYHADNGNPIWANPQPLLPPGAPDEMRPIAMLTDPRERVAAWKALTDHYNDLIAMAARLRRADVGRVFDQTVVEGFRTSRGPGSWPEVDRRLGLNPGRAYRIWRGND